MIEMEHDLDAYAEELQSLHIGDLAPYRERLLTPSSDRPTICAADLLKPANIGNLLKMFAGGFRGDDFRAIASLWSSWYFAIVIPPAVVAIERAQLKPALDLRHVRLSVAPDGTVDGVGIKPTERGGGERAAIHIHEWFVCKHLAPVIDALHRTSGLSRKVLWGNAAATYAWTACTLAPIKPGAAAADLVRSPVLSNGERNEILRALKPCSSPGIGLDRRVCCLRYRLRDHPLCSSCPISTAKKRSTGG